MKAPLSKISYFKLKMIIYPVIPECLQLSILNAEPNYDCKSIITGNSSRLFARNTGGFVIK